MGRVNESALFKKVDTKCGMDMDMHMDMDDCCDDEWSVEIVDDEQQLTNSLTAPKANYFVLYELVLPELALETSATDSTIVLADNGPPDKATPPLYLYYSNIKIPSDLHS